MKLVSRNSEIEINTKHNHPYCKWLKEQLGQAGRVINKWDVTAFMNVFDKGRFMIGEPEMTVYRGDLVEWLWNHRGEVVGYAE